MMWASYSEEYIKRQVEDLARCIFHDWKTIPYEHTMVHPLFADPHISSMAHDLAKKWWDGGKSPFEGGTHDLSKAVRKDR